MPLHRSQGIVRPANWRPDELPDPVETDEAAAERDPVTGRYLPKNKGARRRKLKRLSSQLAGLDASKCAPWLRPSVELAATHSADIIASLPVQSTALNALAIDCATSCAIYRGLLALGAQGDKEALAEARQWLREHRQSLIALTGLARSEAAEPRNDPGALALARVRGEIE